MGPFVFMSKIGEGTFSEVFAVRDERTGRRYACKRLKRLFKTSGEISSFREIRALRSLADHPNIIKFFDVLHDRRTGHLSLVFELMDMNVYDFIKDRSVPVPMTSVKLWIFQLLLALEFMHNMGVFHRDIKPENLMVSGNVLKVADLGSCKSVKSAPPFTDYISTRWYRAPECLLTDGYYSKEMDIWATGCVMFEIMTLMPLFPGENELDQINLIHEIFGTPMNIQSRVELKSYTGNGLRSKFSHPFPDPQTFTLLNQLLIYDYRNRISATNALAHRCFGSIYDHFKSTMYVFFSSKFSPIFFRKFNRQTARAIEDKRVASKAILRGTNSIQIKSDWSYRAPPCCQSEKPATNRIVFPKIKKIETM